MITSVNNSKIKNYTKLKQKKYQKENKLFIIEGDHLVREAIKNNYIKEIFLLKNEKNIYGKVTYVTKEVLKKLSSLKKPPKVIAICNFIKPREIKGNVLILSDIKDPGNAGTIIRSAVAFNYDTIIFSEESVSLYNSKVINATEGMLFNINIITANVKDIIKELKKRNYYIYGTDVINGNSPTKTNEKHALLIGNESKGLDKNIKQLVDENLFIPMNPLCESLNASVAASILMYTLM